MTVVSGVVGANCGTWDVVAAAGSTLRDRAVSARSLLHVCCPDALRRPVVPGVLVPPAVRNHAQTSSNHQLACCFLPSSLLPRVSSLPPSLPCSPRFRFRFGARAVCDVSWETYIANGFCDDFRYEGYNSKVYVRASLKNANAQNIGRCVRGVHFR